MFDHFTPRHIPALLVATTMTLGGIMPFFNAENAIRTFGFPRRVAISKPAQSIMICFSARSSCMGFALWAMYVNQHLEAMDILYATFGYISFVDAYVCLKEEVPGKAVARAMTAGLIGLWGLLGLTAGR